MNEMGSNYVKLEANAVMPMNEGGSSTGGYYESGARINWVSPGGITAQGWYIYDSNSPFYQEDVTAIEEHAERYGNLNTYFEAWGNKVGIDREGFVKQTIEDSCWSLII